jgi:hypothetical protein
VRKLADRSYALLKANPEHQSIHLKKIGQLWSARVGLHYPALAVEAGEALAWFWIGSHAEYDRLVGKKSRGKRSHTAAASNAVKKHGRRR